jgi:DNA-binding GntR family transcriptional regulator
VFSLRLLLEAPATYRATSLIGEEELWQLAQSIESFRKASVRNTWKHLARIMRGRLANVA